MRRTTFSAGSGAARSLTTTRPCVGRRTERSFPVSLTVSPIFNDQGVVIGASKIARDITERARADEERRRLLEMARAANRLKDEFLATLSHELRTPLNAIAGYARLMQARLLDPDKQRRAVDTIVRNASSLTQMIEDVLDVSRIVSGKLRLNVQPVEMSTIIREAVETAPTRRGRQEHSARCHRGSARHTRVG